MSVYKIQLSMVTSFQPEEFTEIQVVIVDKINYFHTTHSRQVPIDFTPKNVCNKISNRFTKSEGRKKCNKTILN